MALHLEIIAFSPSSILPPSFKNQTKSGVHSSELINQSKPTLKKKAYGGDKMFVW